jgi:hypothetical protein
MAIANRDRAATAIVCPATDCESVRKSVPRALWMLLLTLLAYWVSQLRENSRSHVPRGIIPGDFHPTGAILLPPGKTELLSFALEQNDSEWLSDFAPLLCPYCRDDGSSGKSMESLIDRGFPRSIRSPMYRSSTASRNFWKVGRCLCPT